MSRYWQCAQRLIARQAARATDKQPCQLEDAVSASVRTLGGSGICSPAAGQRISDWLPPPQSNSDVRGFSPFQQTRLLSSAGSLSALCSPVTASTGLAARAFVDGQHCRAFSTSTIGQPDAGISTAHPQQTAKAERSVIAEANDVLQQISASQMRDDLAALSEQRVSISLDELLDLCMTSGAATTREGAERLAEALRLAGVVLVHRHTVFLRPEEAAVTVLQGLPDSRAELEAKVAEIEAELIPLTNLLEAAQRSANRKTNSVLWAGMLLLTGQFTVFYWLTWYELSWDVMEPVAYFVSLGTAVAAYMYFLITKESFDYKPLRQRLFSTWQQSSLRARNFDLERYERLTADMARFRRYIRHLHK